MISNIAGGYSSNFDFDKPEIGSEITRSANWIHAMTTIYQRVIKLVIFTTNYYFFLNDLQLMIYLQPDITQPGCLINNSQPSMFLFYLFISGWLFHVLIEFLFHLFRQEVPVQLLGRQFPMDMTQYPNFFCGGRIPGEKKDTLVHNIHLIPNKGN